MTVWSYLCCSMVVARCGSYYAYQKTGPLDQVKLCFGRCGVVVLFYPIAYPIAY